MTQLEVVVDNACEMIPLIQAQPSNDEQLIVVSVINPSVRVEIVRQKNDLEHVKSWFRTVLSDLDAAVPTCLSGGQDNLLMRINAFYATASDDVLEKYADELFEFRTKHDLRFAFRGTDVVSAIICRTNGKLSIHYQHGDEFFVEDIDSYPSIT